MKKPTGILEEMTLDEVRALQANVGLIPIGSTEPHGPALPYGTDTWQVATLAREATLRANGNGARVLCLPVQPVSLNNNFHAFPYACRMSVATFMALLRDLIDLFQGEGVRRILVLNGHGGNPDVIRAVQRDLADREGLFLGLVDFGTLVILRNHDLWEDHADHAGEEESSCMLHLRPDLVRPDALGPRPVNQPALACLRDGTVQFVRPWHRYLPESAGGDASRASAGKGRQAMESGVAELARILGEISAAPDTDGFPYP